MAKKKKVQDIKIEKADSVCVYIGPTIKGFITAGTIFSGTKEEMIALYARAVEKSPLVRNLIVTSKTLSEDRIKVKTPGTALYNYYKKCCLEIKK